MKMVEIQSKFAFDVGVLLGYIRNQGFLATFGEAYRTPLQAWVNSLPADCRLRAFQDGKEIFVFTDSVGGVGIQNSLHRDRLAVDFNFFKSGEIVTDRETLADIGAFWEGLDALNKWGGNFKSRSGDIYHFERRL